MTELETFDRAVATTAGTVKGVGGDQMELPTPCTEWTVRDLLNHLVGSLWFHHQLLSGSPVAHPSPPGGLPDADLVAVDPGAAYAEAAAAALASAGADGALARAVPTPLGEMSGATLTAFITLDVVVHGWDLAMATGQPYDVPDDLTGGVLAFARHAITDTTRAPYIAPATAVGQDASTMHQLIAHMGRHPIA